MVFAVIQIVCWFLACLLLGWLLYKKEGAYKSGYNDAMDEMLNNND